MITKLDLFIRKIIANFLNKNSDYCGTMLAVWLLGCEDFWDIYKNNTEYKNLKCLNEETAWCGKCYITGKKRGYAILNRLLK